MKVSGAQVKKDRFVWMITVLLILSFTAFYTYSWAKLLFLTFGVMIYLCSSEMKGIFIFPWETYQKYMLVFTIYVFFTALWALDADDAVEKSITILQILVVFGMVYFYYHNTSDIKALLSAVKWSGYLVSLYTIYYFGTAILFSSILAERLTNDFANVNTIGLVCALACVIQIFECLEKGFCLQTSLMIPCALVISATQSRKALLFMVVGIISLIWFKSREARSYKGLIYIIIGIVVIIGIYCAVSTLPFFSGLNYRIQMLLNSFTENSVPDHSTQVRNHMIEIGLGCWKENPIGGIGIGCPHIISNSMGTGDNYLHNNYVELLAGGGIIGFAIYYFGYIYLFCNLIKYRKRDYMTASFFFTWLLLMLFTDWGMVSYYSKEQWFYLMIQFIYIRGLRRKSYSAF